MTQFQDDSFKGIDMKELMEIMDNDMELVDDCFADFIETWQGFFSDIKSAAVARDAQGLIQAAHSFKGSLQYLAATHAVAVAHRLELAGKSEDFSTVDEDLEALNIECQLLARFMTSQKDR